MGQPDPYLMAARMGSRLFTQWMAHSIIEASDANPEPTEWDDDLSRKRKAARKAATGAKWQRS